MTYQVKDWDANFENDRSRQRKTCSFVCVPNKQHGMGFCRVVSEPDGAAIYGIWQMILGACSQQSQPRHGWLTSDGEQAGSAWGVADLSMKFRRPESEVSRALEVLSSESIGWLKCHKSPDDHRQVTAKSPPTHLERREEKEEKEEKRSGASLPQSALMNEVIEAWNATRVFPQCLQVSDKRRQTLKIRLAEPFFLANWKAALEKSKSSEFLRGENGRGWKASFDWFIGRDSVVKIMEGKYHGNGSFNGRDHSRKKTDAEILEEACQ